MFYVRIVWFDKSIRWMLKEALRIPWLNVTLLMSITMSTVRKYNY